MSTRSSTPASPRVFADIDRQKAQMLGVPPERVFQTLAGLSRLGVRQRLQSARPHLSCDRAGRRTLPPYHRRHRQSGRRDPIFGTMVPLSAIATFQDRTGPIAWSATISHPAVSIDGDTAPGISSASRSRPWKRSPRPERCRAATSTEWIGIADQQKYAGNTAGYGLCPCRAARLPGAGGAVWRAWSMPLAIILIVPNVGAGGDGRASTCAAWTTTS